MRTPKEHREQELQRYYARKFAGVCVRCGAKTLRGETLCPMHKHKHDANKKKYQKKLVSARVCVACGAPLAANSKRYCESHLLYNRLRYAEQKRAKEEGKNE